MALSDVSIKERNAIVEEHQALINELRDIEARITSAIDKGEEWDDLEKERNDKQKYVEPLIEKYWQWIQPVRLSWCPICAQDLYRTFDPIDFKGFWWMDRTQRPVREPKPCSHFCLMTGAVDRGGQPFPNLLFEAFVGPEFPYVIPRILNLPTMIAVVTQIPMECGFVAYPVCYFSEHPPKEGDLTQSWTKREHRFKLDDGSEEWDILEDEHDTNIIEWATKGKFIFHDKWDDEEK